MAWQWTPHFLQQTTSEYYQDSLLIKKQIKCTPGDCVIKPLINHVPQSLDINIKKNFHKRFIFQVLAQKQSLEFLNQERNSDKIQSFICYCCNRLLRDLTRSFNFLRSKKQLCDKNLNSAQQIRFSKCSNIRFLLQFFILITFIFVYCYGEDSAQEIINKNKIKNIDSSTAINGSK